MWLPFVDLMQFSAFVKALAPRLMQGSAVGMGLGLISVSALALIQAAFQAPVVSTPLTSLVQQSASGVGESRPAGRHPGCPLSCSPCARF